MTTSTRREELRVEFEKLFPFQRDIGNNSRKKVADWWLSKLDQECKLAEEAERERIMGLIPLYRAGKLEDGDTEESRRGRNETLKEVRDLLSQSNHSEI